MLPRDVAKRLIGFRRIDRKQLDPHRPVEIKNGNDVAIVDLDDASKQSRCGCVGGNENDEKKSVEEMARHESPRVKS
jgi:hypothetical protein